MTTDTTPAAAPTAPPARDYTSEPQQVVCTLIHALLDTWPEPQTPSTLATRTDYSRDQCYRGLRNLESAGLAEATAVGWTIGPALTTASERIRQRTAALLGRYLGTPGATS